MGLLEGAMAESGARLPRMAVYYPYIHFRDARWLKVAALYWPHMVRIVHPDYPTRNSRLVQILQDELGFVVDHSPTTAARTMVGSFLEFVNTLPSERHQAWRVRRELAYRDPQELAEPQPFPLTGTEHDCVPDLERYGPAQWADPQGLAERIRAGALADVHASELASHLAEHMIDAELAVPARGDWFAMHPELAWIYKCRLTEELARRNNLAVTTDQLAAHAVISGPLNFAPDTGASHDVIDRPGISDTFGLLCVTAVVPRDLDQVPVEKIIEVRRRYGAEFDRWREYIDRVGAGLADQLRQIESPVILKTYLSDAVSRYAKAPVEGLRRGLADVGIDTAALALNNKFEMPAGLATTGLLVHPQLAVAAGVAFGALSLRRTARAKAEAARVAPAAYLLSVQQTLAPQTWLSRVMAAARRAAGLSP
ncbi:DUF6236 family protein [Micromonospora sp. NPDC049559]|uniref:DUF6236 family protein n=1 Tax=Micromonospora sp. NPDC049559 TaxID=3155923 RepID=UPI0034185BAE